MDKTITQISFPEAEYEQKKRITRREKFLDQMDTLVPLESGGENISILRQKTVKVDNRTLCQQCCAFTHGKKLKTVELLAQRNERYSVNLSEHLTDVMETCGTFCVFHASTPVAVSALGSFLVERGYVNYRYKNAGLRSYVHGNLDAVALIEGKNLEMLGSNSLLRRVFNLQYAMTGDADYRLTLVNPTAKAQRAKCTLHDVDNGKLTDEWRVELSPRACHLIDLPSLPNVTRLARIHSHLVMARPIIFRISNQKLDVFHG